MLSQNNTDCNGPGRVSRSQTGLVVFPLCSCCWVLLSPLQKPLRVPGCFQFGLQANPDPLRGLKIVGIFLLAVQQGVWREGCCVCCAVLVLIAAALWVIQCPGLTAAAAADLGIDVWQGLPAAWSGARYECRRISLDKILQLAGNSSALAAWGFCFGFFLL